MSLVTPEAFVLGMSALGGGIVMIGILGIGIGQGFIGGKAVEGISRQPEASGTIMTTMLVGQAIAETSTIFAFLMSIILIFVNPLVGML